MTFDVDAYLARIGLVERPAADLAGLMAIQQAHRLAIPFENLDIPLGRGISIDPDAVFAKIVVERRGGYCFEQNQLFLRALLALGFVARPLLARVWLMNEGAVPPLTHTLNLVTIDGRLWIADAGFGGSSVPPLLLAEGHEAQTSDGARHRLVRDPAHEWMLERAGNPHATDGRARDTLDWQPQYSFTLGTVAPVDLELGNHWTSTKPGTRFTTLLVASIVTADGFVSLTDRSLGVTIGADSQRRDIVDADDMRGVLAEHFGIMLDADAVAGLI